MVSCKTKEDSDHIHASQFRDTLQLPEDSLAFYFPANSLSDDPSTDSFIQNWYSSALYSLRQPVLAQNYVGHDIYRFLWLRSFHRPVVFTLHKSKDQVWLNTRMLDKQPAFYDHRMGGVSKEDREEYFKNGYIIDSIDTRLLVRIADRKADMIYNKNILLSNREWKKFEQLLEKAKFWDLPTDMDSGDSDGAQWIFEAHLKNKYHLVSYQSPYKNEYAKAGLFLIKLSGLGEEVY